MKPQYSHKEYEDSIYDKWERSGAFTPPSADEARAKSMKPFTIIMPPPNANDPLHVGHAMFLSLEDALIRYHRMLGEAALWLPGTDHAGIETQYVFEKKLNKEGKSRLNFDRESLYQMIWDYVQENSGVAINQMKKLGASADWTRKKFTLDEDCVDLTLSTFERMHSEGLIERKQALVNYCTKCGTAYSQLELVHEERTSPLYYVRYPHADNPESFEVVATTRPEPIFADTHLAVHPKDPKRKDLIGMKLLNPLTKAIMEVIGDEFVVPEFGSGLVKLTPAHDHNDFEVAKRHGLPMNVAINHQGKIVEMGGKYAGLSVLEARKQVVKDLESTGLMDKIDTQYQNSVATCYRCGRDIEPMPMSQFFVKVKSLVADSLAALDNGDTEIYGAGHDKILRHWLNNLNDWNISRQIVWGIRLPVWYRVDSSHDTQITSEIMVGFLDHEGKFVAGIIGELLEKYDFELIEKNLQTLSAPSDANYIVSRNKPSESGRWLQETDTFDTWFSSSQWPVNTLLAQEEGSRFQVSGSRLENLKLPYTSEDFEYYYPTSVMETGYDILPFWVMRMMMMGIYMTGKTPFEKVYLHGLVRDEKGQKMSKSKGNVINPLDLVDKYGADALRMALMMSTTPGHDSAVGETKVKGMRNFANKIWNAARYVLMTNENLENVSREISTELNSENSEKMRKERNIANEDKINNQERADRKFVLHLKDVVNITTAHLNQLRPGQAAELVHNEFWHWYCDEQIELAKNGHLSPVLLEQGLQTFLKLLHPFVPFVTEAVWQEMNYEGLLIKSKWPNLE